MNQPERLSKLTLDSFANYINELFFKILLTCDVNEYWIHSAKSICNRLHIQLIRTVPSPLADEVTNRLLMCVDDVCYRMEILGEQSLNVENLQDVLNCVIHPDVKRIQPVPTSLRCSDVFQQTILLLLHIKVITP